MGHPVGPVLSVQTSPGDALASADAKLASAAGPDASPGDRAAAQWEKGLALRELNRPDEAIAEFESAIEQAGQEGDDRLAARVRVSLAYVFAQTGRFDRATEQLDVAQPDLAGADLSEGLAQRALISQHAGHFEEAIDSWVPALDAFRRTGDSLGEAMARLNCGVARCYVGGYHDALADFEAAESLFRAQGSGIGAAEAVHNRGFVASRLGDLPVALRLFDQAQRELGAIGVSEPHLLLDRVETLVKAGLPGEALAVAGATSLQLEEAHLQADLAELSVIAAGAAEEVGDLGAAAQWAEQAVALFAAQGRTRWEALARFAMVRAACSLAAPPVGDAELRAAQADLQLANWPDAAFDAAVLRVTRLAGADTAGARAILQQAKPLVAGLPASSRAQLWVAEAILRRAEGRRAAALQAVEAGVELLEVHQASLGAAELRVRAGARIEQLAEIGASMELEAASPDRVFAWLERGRAAADAGDRRDVLHDQETADALMKCRQIAFRLEQDIIGERDALRLRRQLSALEEVVRRRTRHVSGQPAPGTAPRQEGNLVDAIGDGVLVIYGAVDGWLVGVGLGDGQWRATRLCRLEDAVAAVDTLRHALVDHLSGHRRSAALVVDLARRAQDLLIGFVGDWLPAPDASPVLLIPGPLQAMPWAALPGLAAVPFTVTPSASVWLTARQPDHPAPPGLRVLVVAGPGLDNASLEAATVAGIYPDPLVLGGADATVAGVLAHLAEVEIAHVACHGSFRADNPQFSSLRLADGPLNAYDLSSVERFPQLCVLSACDIGLADAAGAGALGVAASFLAGGAAAVLASVLPADDLHTPTMMEAFHRAFATGRPAAEALADARSTLDDPLLAAGFTLYGASVRVLGRYLEEQ